MSGRFAVAADYLRHLRDVLGAHEDSGPLRHIRCTLLIQGDVRDTLPGYLRRNPQTVVALAYFDLDRTSRPATPSRPFCRT